MENSPFQKMLQDFEVGKLPFTRLAFIHLLEFLLQCTEALLSLTRCRS